MKLKSPNRLVRVIRFLHGEGSGAVGRAVFGEVSCFSPLNVGTVFQFCLL